MAERCMTLLKNVLPSNGSRLNCGRNANGRKVVEQMRRCGSEATQFFFKRLLDKECLRAPLKSPAAADERCPTARQSQRRWT